MAGISLSGLGSGLDTQTIITQLMQIEARPQTLLTQRKTAVQAQLDAWGAIQTSMSKLSDTAKGLADDGGWSSLSTSTSDATVATVLGTGVSGASGGTVSFTVDRLARAGAMVSAGTVNGSTTKIFDGNLLLTKGADTLGFMAFSAPTLATGTRVVTVTQASAGASLTGTELSMPVTIDGANDALSFSVNGESRVATLAHGSYDLAGLTEAIGAAIGADLVVGTSGGALTVTTTAQGSEATLELTGGTGLVALGLSGLITSTGTDGIVTVDGIATTVTDARAGITVALATEDGSITATLGGGLSTGSATVKSVATGGGTLAEVVGAVNRSGTGIGAAAVQVAPGAYRLQFTSQVTGAGSNPSIAADTFTGLTLVPLTAGRDAQVTLGEGAAAYSVTSATNAFTGLIEGAAVTVNKVSATAVSISATPDAGALADKVAGLVTTFNATADLIKAKSSNTPTSKAALAGDAASRRLLNQLYQTFATASASGTASLGLTLGRDGKLGFDRAKFITKFTDDPIGAGAVFKKLTATSDSRVQIAATGAKLAPGTYQVVVSQAATRASRTGPALTGALAGSETITVTVAGRAASYAATAGQGLPAVAAGLNAAFVAGKIAATASVIDGALRVESGSYGATAGLTVQSTAAGVGQTGIVSTAGGTETSTGTDVRGHFVANGLSVAAAGTGQQLRADAGTSLDGLAVRVTATPEDITGDTPLGTLTYGAGLAQALTSFVARVTSSAGGTVQAAQDGRKADLTTLTTQIDAWTERLNLRKTALQNQFQAMETALSRAKTTQSWLTSQISSLTGKTSG